MITTYLFLLFFIFYVRVEAFKVYIFFDFRVLFVLGHFWFSILSPYFNKISYWSLIGFLEINTFILWSKHGKEKNEEQFGSSRLLACISSHPGQCGGADEYILEDKKLEFYTRKIKRKKGKGA